ncbi:MAG: ABC transporter ATP-binding protein [Nitriliruptorales bacterium]|nr:ABC transporter ATP-binding protein [Nitriliruptorales bacterium]
MRPAAIEIRGLVKRYGDHTAVDGIDLTVAQGETLALLGPNGAGKTTTVECCEGYRRPDGGSVRVLGLDPLADAEALKPRLGLMLQEGGVYPMAYPAEVLRLFAAFYRDPLDPDALLEQVGLGNARRTRFRDLSGGQKQRLALALALVGRPEVVFLDEPTAGLDPSARRMTWEHIRSLQREGVAIVLTTHLLDEAEELADRVAIIDRGHIIAEGTPDELTHGTQTELRFSARPGLELDGVVPGTAVIEKRPGRYVLEGDVTPEVIAALTAELARRGVLIGELQASKRSLEQVFLELVEDREGGR